MNTFCKEEDHNFEYQNGALGVETNYSIMNKCLTNIDKTDHYRKSRIAIIKYKYNTYKRNHENREYLGHGWNASAIFTLSKKSQTPF